MGGSTTFESTPPFPLCDGFAIFLPALRGERTNVYFLKLLILTQYHINALTLYYAKANMRDLKKNEKIFKKVLTNTAHYDIIIIVEGIQTNDTKRQFKKT